MRLNFQERSELKIQSRTDPAIGGISGLYLPALPCRSLGGRLVPSNLSQRDPLRGCEVIDLVPPKNNAITAVLINKKAPVRGFMKSEINIVFYF
jgi:hypothetical protein